MKQDGEKPVVGPVIDVVKFCTSINPEYMAERRMGLAIAQAIQPELSNSTATFDAVVNELVQFPRSYESGRYANVTVEEISGVVSNLLCCCREDCLPGLMATLFKPFFVAKSAQQYGNSFKECPASIVLGVFREFAWGHDVSHSTDWSFWTGPIQGMFIDKLTRLVKTQIRSHDNKAKSAFHLSYVWKSDLTVTAIHKAAYAYFANLLVYHRSDEVESLLTAATSYRSWVNRRYPCAKPWDFSDFAYAIIRAAKRAQIDQLSQARMLALDTGPEPKPVATA